MDKLPTCTHINRFQFCSISNSLVCEICDEKEGYHKTHVPDTHFSFNKEGIQTIRKKLYFVRDAELRINHCLSDMEDLLNIINEAKETMKKALVEILEFYTTFKPRLFQQKLNANKYKEVNSIMIKAFNMKKPEGEHMMVKIRKAADDLCISLRNIDKKTEEVLHSSPLCSKELDEYNSQLKSSPVIDDVSPENAQSLEVQSYEKIKTTFAFNPIKKV